MTAPKRLLVLDDDKEFADYIVSVATPMGCSATATYRAADFQSLYQRDRPDVVVLDVVMPETDGIEMISWLAAQDCRARILVISGHDPLFSKAVKALGEGIGQMSVTTLNKPVRLAALRDALALALDVRAGP